MEVICYSMDPVKSNSTTSELVYSEVVNYSRLSKRYTSLRGKHMLGLLLYIYYCCAMYFMRKDYGKMNCMKKYTFFYDGRNNSCSLRQKVYVHARTNVSIIVAVPFNTKAAILHVNLYCVCVEAN